MRDADDTADGGTGAAAAGSLSSRVNGDLSLRALLAGFFQRCGGPAATGEILGDIFLDEGVNVQTRVRVADIATRLVGQHIADESGAGLETPEMIEEEMRRLTRGTE